MSTQRIFFTCALFACLTFGVCDGWAADNWSLEIHGNVTSAPSPVPVLPLTLQDPCSNTGGATCGAATLLGTVCGDLGSDEITLSQCGPGWFRVFVSECASGFFDLIDLNVVLRLVPPAGGMDYDLYLFESCGAPVDSSTRGPGEAEQVSAAVRDFLGSDESRFFYVEIRSASPVGVGDSDPGRGSARLLLQSSPNPMRLGSVVRYTLPTASSVRVVIVDSRGRLVRSLDEGFRAHGTHEVRWDGQDFRGADAPPGLYFARVEAMGRHAVGKLTLLR